MRTAIRNTGLVAALVLLTGCASAKLQLDLAIYKEDPTAGALLNQEQVDAMIMDLDTIGNEAKDYADSRNKLGAGLVDVITAFSALRGEVRAKASAPPRSYSPEQAAQEQAIFRGYLSKFNRAIGDRLADVDARIVDARTALARYRNLLLPTEQPTKTGSTATKGKDGGVAAPSLPKQNQILAAQFAVRSSIEMVAISVQQLTGDLGTDLENVIRDDLKGWAAAMKPEVLEKLGANEDVAKKVDLLRTNLEELQRTIIKIEADGTKIAEGVKKQFAGTLAALESDEPSGLSKTVKTIATAVTALPDSLRFSDGGTQAISDITRRTALLSSQIERLQNPADPVWRIVTDPANAAKWNETFNQTYFKAEGNTSVTVVRDSPVDFRIQQGANNPAALVKAQLQVSRAIGNAALTVAGAAAGVDLTAFGQQPQTTDAQPDQAESDAEKLARRQATVREERAFRANAVRGLVISLRNFREQLSDPNLTDVAAKPITDNMLDALRGYQKVLQTNTDIQATNP